jgi:hypothetical protein
MAEAIERLRAYFNEYGLDVKTWDELEFPRTWDFGCSQLIFPTDSNHRQYDLHVHDDWPLPFGVVGCYSRWSHDAASDAA